MPWAVALIVAMLWLIPGCSYCKGLSCTWTF